MASTPDGNAFRTRRPTPISPLQAGLDYQWNDDAKASLHDYNTRDLSI